MEYTKVLLLFAYQGLLFYQADNGLIFTVPIDIANEKSVSSEAAATEVEPWIENAMVLLKGICQEVSSAYMNTRR